VIEKMNEFDDELHNKQYPEKVCIIVKEWYEKWKLRVSYNKLDKAIKDLNKPRVFKSVNMQSSGPGNE
jgi:hypothetical protein